MSASVVAVCVGREKGQPKEPVASVNIIKDKGIEGDVHAKGGIRQISLLSLEDIEGKYAGTRMEPGVFAENILTRGVDFKKLSVGSELQIGAAKLRISQFGKECHTSCSIREKTGDCIMPSDGVFAVALEGGEVKVGDTILIL